MTQDNYNRIEKYLKEQMTPEENEAFLNDLRKDKNLRKEAQMMALMIKEMKEKQAKQDAEIIKETLASKKRAIIVNLARITISIAAMFILVFGAYQFWGKQPNTDAIFDKYYMAAETTTPRGAEDDAIKKELTTLFNKIGTEKDISTIIDRLQTIYDNIQAENEVYDEYRYSKIRIAKYLALAYIKVKIIDKAKELLKPLADYGDEEAKQMLKDLDDL